MTNQEIFIYILISEACTVSTRTLRQKCKHPLIGCPCQLIRAYHTTVHTELHSTVLECEIDVAKLVKISDDGTYNLF